MTPGAGAGAGRSEVLDARVLVVMGVSGSGKSTVAATVAERLGWDFAEGDAMHPRSNVDKMQAGTPLTDEDRWPWLDVVAGWIRDHLDAGTPWCRDVLGAEAVVPRRAPRTGGRLRPRRGDGALIADRMAARSGHFMPTSLLASQLATLEVPGADEAHVTVAADRTPEEEADEVVERLGLGVH